MVHSAKWREVINGKNLWPIKLLMSFVKAVPAQWWGKSLKSKWRWRLLRLIKRRRDSN